MSAPDRIYLQWGESYPGSTDPDADNVTWCPVRVEPYDVEYVRADQPSWLEQERFLQSRIEALEAEAERLAGIVREHLAKEEASIDALEDLKARVPDPDDLRVAIECVDFVEPADYRQLKRRLRATLEGTE